MSDLLKQLMDSLGTVTAASHAARSASDTRLRDAGYTEQQMHIINALARSICATVKEYVTKACEEYGFDFDEIMKLQGESLRVAGDGLEGGRQMADSTFEAIKKASKDE